MREIHDQLQNNYGRIAIQAGIRENMTRMSARLTDETWRLRNATVLHTSIRHEAQVNDFRRRLEELNPYLDRTVTLHSPLIVHGVNFESTIIYTTLMHNVTNEFTIEARSQQMSFAQLENRLAETETETFTVRFSKWLVQSRRVLQELYDWCLALRDHIGLYFTITSDTLRELRQQGGSSYITLRDSLNNVKEMAKTIRLALGKTMTKISERIAIRDREIGDNPPTFNSNMTDERPSMRDQEILSAGYVIPYGNEHDHHADARATQPVIHGIEHDHHAEKKLSNKEVQVQVNTNHHYEGMKRDHHGLLPHTIPRIDHYVLQPHIRPKENLFNLLAQVKKKRYEGLKREPLLTLRMTLLC